YIAAFDEVTINDIYNKKRKLDFILVDSNGNIDVVEIKRPFNKSIVSQNKYRDNYIPLRELSGSVMQIEKYVFYLNKWGIKGEEILTKKFKNDLPKNFRIKIINPGGLIIMGRENDLTNEQLADFEVIKRKYINIIDIITYDELILRIEKLIDKFNQ
ncbi:MAG: Shedu immune nuclease family protein, partial [Candidatus Humimicrobiaceae bacterium]